MGRLLMFKELFTEAKPRGTFSDGEPLWKAEFVDYKTGKVIDKNERFTSNPKSFIAELSKNWGIADDIKIDKNKKTITYIRSRQYNMHEGKSIKQDIIDKLENSPKVLVQMKDNSFAYAEDVVDDTVYFADVEIMHRKQYKYMEAGIKDIKRLA